MKVYGKKFLIICIMLNFLILSVGFFKVLTSQQEDIILESIPLYSWGEEFGSDNYFSQTFPIAKYWFSVKTGALEAGVYNINISYDTNGEHFYLSCNCDVDGQRYPTIYADDYLLNPQKNNHSFQIWINDKISFLEVNINCGETDKILEDSYLQLDKIEIARDFSGTFCYAAINMILMLCMLDGILFVYWRWDRIRNNFYVVFGLGLILLANSLGIFTHSQIFGHDLTFHLGRIIGLKEALHAGNFPVRLQPGWCNDYGYATSIFYGDILLHIPAILYGLKVPLIYAYKAYLFIVNLGTLVISYYCFKKISKDRYIGIVCTALYCLSINRILNVYLRAAVGEYSACMFLPLIVLAMWEILTSDIRQKDYRYNWIFLCLGMTGVIQTHTLSFEMVSIFLVLVCAISIKRVLQKEVFLELFKGCLATICLNLSFLIPFIDYASEDLSVFSEKKVYGIQHYGLSIYELLSIGTSAKGQALDSTKGLSNRFPESLGITILIIIIGAVLLLLKNHKWDKKEKERLEYVLIFSMIAIYLSTYHFPWNKIASIKLLQNVVSSIQFPWRFVSIAVPLLILVACIVLVRLKKDIQSGYMKAIMVGMCALAACQGLLYIDIIARNTQNYVKYDGSHLLDVKETLSVGEYLYTGTDLELVLKDTEVSGGNLQAIHMDRIKNQVNIWCKADKNAYIEVPLFAYPHYQCIDEETGENYVVNKGSNNKIRIELPDGYNGNLRIFFKEPWYWRCAEILSALTAIFLVVYILKIKVKFLPIYQYMSSQL